MNLFTLAIILNHSIVLAAIAAIARVKYILRSYYPFLIFVWLAFLNETVSLILIENHRPNSVNSNIYVLVEYLLLLFQFYKWKGREGQKFCFFAIAGVVVWIADNAVINSITGANSLFRSFASCLILFCSIGTMKSLIRTARGRLMQNAAFLACTAFLVYYGCKAFVEVFHLFKVPFTSLFFSHLWLMLSVVNCFCNVAYAITVLCIPTKEEFILPYSRQDVL